VHVVNAPASFEPMLAELEGRTVRRAVTDEETVSFVIAFAITQAEHDSGLRHARSAAEGHTQPYPRPDRDRHPTSRTPMNRPARSSIAGVTRAA
jgi:hypothetical protein